MYLSLKPGALDKILAELPKDAHVLQACLTIVKEGPAVRIEWMPFDNLGQARPKGRQSMLYNFGQIEPLLDGWVPGSKITSVMGLYQYPMKQIDSRPAIIRVSAVPRITSGSNASSSFSRSPAISTRARVKPAPAPTA